VLFLYAHFDIILKEEFTAGADIPENLELNFLYPVKHFLQMVVLRSVLKFKPSGCNLISVNTKYLKDRKESEGLLKQQNLIVIPSYMPPYLALTLEEE
jgi:hypothetical protein